MNLKKAKMLRGIAGYRNQTATPGTMPFPGVARAYRHPVYATRTYKRRDGTTVTHMVIHNGKPVLEMETFAAGKLPVEFDADGKPTAFNTEPVTRVKEELVPVTKPAKLDPKCPKGVYRSLKRLHRKGLLDSLNLPIEVTA